MAQSGIGSTLTNLVMTAINREATQAQQLCKKGGVSASATFIKGDSLKTMGKVKLTVTKAYTGHGRGQPRTLCTLNFGDGSNRAHVFAEVAKHVSKIARSIHAVESAETGSKKRKTRRRQMAVV